PGSPSATRLSTARCARLSSGFLSLRTSPKMNPAAVVFSPGSLSPAGFADAEAGAAGGAGGFAGGDFGRIKPLPPEPDDFDLGPGATCAVSLPQREQNASTLPSLSR